MHKALVFVKKILFLLEPFRGYLVFISILSVVFEVVRLLGPYFFGRIIDVLYQTQGKITLQTGLYIIGALIGIRFLSIVLDYVTDIIIERFLWISEKFIATKSFNKMLQLSMDYHEKENTGAKIALINRGTDKLIELLNTFAFSFQPIFLQIIVTIVLTFLQSPLMSVVFSISIIPFLMITFGMFHRTRHLRVARFDAYEESSGELGDTISNIAVVKAFAQEGREQDAFTSLWGSIVGIYKSEYKIRTIFSLFRSVFVEVCYTILLLIGIFQIQQGQMTVGTLVFMISLSERAYSNIYRLGRIYNRAVDAMEPVERIANLLSEKPSVKNDPNPVVLEHVSGEVEFRQVNFGYRKRNVLKNVSFKIPAGSFTAIVGKSGGGKSTVVKLICRYYDPSTGSIIIDGKHDLKRLDLDNYRRHLSVVFQDSPVPNRKIWEIISYAGGKADFTDIKEAVIEAAKLAHAHEFISQFEDGYDTVVGERGVKLSGGQKQRLAIARALFNKPSILIMDEPTSHLDTLSEHLIQQSLEQMSKERSFTKIVIAHRLSTIAHADQILVMEKGRVKEVGTHQQLIKKDGIYASIVHQSKL